MLRGYRQNQATMASEGAGCVWSGRREAALGGPVGYAGYLRLGVTEDGSYACYDTGGGCCVCVEGV
jgi:hypothetical protein